MLHTDLPTNTIAAASSPPGQSLRGLIRISGPDSFPILQQLTVAPLSSQSHRVQSVQIALTHPTDIILPVQISLFQGPNSYTGHDTVELQCPGHPALLEWILQALFKLGCRPAEPGEFTFQAYLNGKLDLTQAEGVNATIAAESDAQLNAAEMLRQGRLRTQASQVTDELANALALTEAGIDFVDQEDVVAISPADLHARIQHILTTLKALLSRSRSWHELQGLPRVVLVGPPSVGKSTLFNRMLDRQRAVTDALPGTTRDILTENWLIETDRLDPIEVMLCDLAGLDSIKQTGESSATIETAMQTAARQAIAQADVIVELFLDRPLPESIRPAHRGDWLIVQPQSDRFSHEAFRPQLSCSAVTGQGISDVIEAIALAVESKVTASSAAQTLAIQPRHEAALREALDHLMAVDGELQPQLNQSSLDDMETLAGSMRLALDALASLGGEMTPDDIIGRVFASFCVGK